MSKDIIKNLTEKYIEDINNKDFNCFYKALKKIKNTFGNEPDKFGSMIMHYEGSLNDLMEKDKPEK